MSDGDKAVIIGEEGNGKSTLLKFLYDENLIKPYARATGTAVRKGKFGYLPQFMPEKDGELTVREYFEGVDLYSAFELVENLRLSYDFLNSDRKISTLSGGEKVKIQLLKLLGDGVDGLLLDEPSNDLDVQTLCFLQDFIASTPLPVIFISHDETLIRATANVIIHIEQLIKKTTCKVTVASLTYDEYVDMRNLQFDRQTQIAKKERADARKQFDRWQKIFERVQHEQRTISRGDPHGGRLLKKKMKSVTAQRNRFEKETQNMTEIPDRESCIITRFDENISLPAQKRVLDFDLPELKIGDKVLALDIKLNVVGGEKVCIIGENGAGKSTLLKKILTALNERTDICVGYMPQNYEDVLNYSETPSEYFEANFDGATLTRAMTFMGNMKFTADEMRHAIGNLSGGQRAKIIFLNMVLRGANVLVLDEPTRNFSPLSAPVIRSALSDFGGTIISISHDRLYLDEVADKVYILTEKGLELI